MARAQHDGPLLGEGGDLVVAVGEIDVPELEERRAEEPLR